MLGIAACSGGSDLGESAPSSVNDVATQETETTVTTVPEDAQTETAAPPLTGTLTATVINTYPHDENAFTQGLQIVDGQFIESTGLYGESSRRIVDIETGEPLVIEPLDADLFGEGITVVGDEVLQLTWQAGVLIRSDVNTLEETGRDSYEGEGWGLCLNSTELAMSNGSATLTFRDPDTFAAIRSVDVTLDGAPVENLNELECVNGQIIANIWLADLIIVIDPDTGEVVATLDGSNLRPDGLPATDSSFALNGIAHDRTTGHFFVTGKLWPVIYEVELS